MYKPTFSTVFFSISFRSFLNRFLFVLMFNCKINRKKNNVHMYWNYIYSVIAIKISFFYLEINFLSLSLLRVLNYIINELFRWFYEKLCIYNNINVDACHNTTLWTTNNNIIFNTIHKTILVFNNFPHFLLTCELIFAIVTNYKISHYIVLTYLTNNIFFIFSK